MLREKFKKLFAKTPGHDLFSNPNSVKKLGGLILLLMIPVISGISLDHSYGSWHGNLSDFYAATDTLHHGSRSNSTGQSKPYVIIIGSFKSRENAENLVSELQSKGYDASLAGKSANGMFRVSIATLSRLDQAGQQLEIIKTSGFPSAWILEISEKEISISPAPGIPEPKKTPVQKQADEPVKHSAEKTASPIPDLCVNTLSVQYYRLSEALKKYCESGASIENDSTCTLSEEEMNSRKGKAIEKILVNMERCRQISQEYARAKTYIVVNIPAFSLEFVHDGQLSMNSPVVVGDSMTKTGVFGALLTSIVFCPYWNVPKSIIDKEVLPGMALDSNYLKKYKLEWNNGQIRQKPGKYNALGLIKFVLPNPNDIYLHDSPVKSLYKKEFRAFSHGCIRVKKSKDLAYAILKDEGWSLQKIDEVMKAGEECTYILKTRIPVYIGYFTAWVDEQGKIKFYNDVYHLDDSSASRINKN
jgi:hypothetical protein